jgi:hypothetical protein
MEARRPRAKTTLPGLGDPIIGIDVTEDGRWILATCRTYIIVIPTDLPNGNTGFEKPMGKYKVIIHFLSIFASFFTYENCSLSLVAYS